MFIVVKKDLTVKTAFERKQHDEDENTILIFEANSYELAIAANVIDRGNSKEIEGLATLLLRIRTDGYADGAAETIVESLIAEDKRLSKSD